MPTFPWTLYVDMDAFYVSCELRDHPELIGKPVIVGPDPRVTPNRGVVLSASYDLRPLGIRSALPAVQAARLAPQAHWVAPDFAKYERASREVRDLLSHFSSRVVPLSIDEAAVTVECATPADVEAKCREIQKAIADQLHLPASIGAAPFRVVAKIASDRAKPGGVCVVSPERVAEFLGPLDLKVVPGVGPKTRELLHSLGIERIGDLTEGASPEVARKLGTFSSYLVRLAQGNPPETDDEGETGPHSRSSDHTFDRDEGDESVLVRTAEELASYLARSLSEEGLRYQTVSVAARWEDFSRTSRSRTLGASVEGETPLRTPAARLLRELLSEERRGRQRRVRTLSVRAERLTPRTGSQRRLDEYL
ncbi:MAG: DNA polymerase IV [Thermoplasmata archaeon]|nr:DNA polymerase IV [Thermoplasmata archaeon]